MQALILTARIVLATIFVGAAIGKLQSGLARSRRTLAEFGIPRRMVAPLAIVLPGTELLVAVFLVVPQLAWLGSILASLIFLSFAVAIVINLRKGKKPLCNCFGRVRSQPIGWSVLLLDWVLFATASGVAWHLRTQTSFGLSYLLHVMRSLSMAAVETVAIVIAFLLLGSAIVHLIHTTRELRKRIAVLEAAARPLHPIANAVVTRTDPVNAANAPSFELADANGNRETLGTLLSKRKPLLLVATDLNCGPCHLLFPDIAAWQKALESELTIATLGGGDAAANREKAADNGLKVMLLDEDRTIGTLYCGTVTPSARIVGRDGTLRGSPTIGVDAIRILISDRKWEKL